MALEGLILPLAIILGGIIFAYFFDKVVLKKLSKLATKTFWDGDDIIVSSLKNISKYPIIAFSIYIASIEFPFTPVVHHYIFKFFIIVTIIFFTLIVSRIAVGLVRLLPGRSDGAFPGSSIFVNVTKILIFIFGFIFLLQQLGISIAPIITALGVGGLAVALALQDTLANLFAGLNVIAGRRLKQGDFIQLENGQEGVIEDITWRNTVVRELSNTKIIVPNTKMATSIIKNYTIPQLEIFVVVKISLDYNSDLVRVEKILVEVARQVMQEGEGTIVSHEPFVRFKEFADSSIDCEVFMKSVSFAERPLVRHNFIKKLHQVFQKEGIIFPFPTRTLHIETNQSDTTATP